jgi:carboxylesterase
MSYLGRHLADKGYSVLGVRLAGHATQPADLIRTRWQDWLASVEDGWHLLKDNTDQIFVIGLSMGGVLSLLFASEFPVAGVVAMATPYKIILQGWQRHISQFLIPLSIIKPYIKKGPPNWFNPEALKERVAYDVNVTRSMQELKLLLAEMDASLPKINVPALLIHSEDDGYVSPRNMPEIYTALGSTDKKMMMISKNSHVITEDGDREQVFELITDFITRISNQ